MKKLDIAGMLSMGKKYKYVIAVMLLGILLISMPGGGEDKKDTPRESIAFDVKKFEAEIEKALTASEGVGRARVIISLDSSIENVYAKEARQSSKNSDGGEVRENDSDMKPSIMSEGSGKESPIVVKEIYPSFRGALVICDGADDISIRADIIDSVSALTGLSSDKISVIKMKK